MILVAYKVIANINVCANFCRLLNRSFAFVRINYFVTISHLVHIAQQVPLKSLNISLVSLGRIKSM
jgi:hypothetical protein